MALTCKQLWSEVSNYIDGSVSAEMRAEIERHLAQCRHCTALIDGVHNVVVLVADGRTFELPTGFSERLRERLKYELQQESL
ncbi:MAG TPA: zf-HC2 domain-containing protein [Candidatus Saccharimonadales bacterium]|jgi:anti-sigma factor RsiW|nr:zf-HC2 domain-containing protein [Candidatus Saccharimonadales bacterium]